MMGRLYADGGDLLGLGWSDLRSGFGDVHKVGKGVLEYFGPVGKAAGEGLEYVWKETGVLPGEPKPEPPKEQPAQQPLEQAVRQVVERARAGAGDGASKGVAVTPDAAAKLAASRQAALRDFFARRAALDEARRRAEAAESSARTVKIAAAVVGAVLVLGGITFAATRSRRTA